MSGLLSTFQSLLQQAYWRGVPFLVDASETTKGRKLAVHEYPFRDGGWMEDMGRKQREFRMTGHLVGDFAPVMQLLLDTAIELPGPGLLIHPTLGAMKVALISASTVSRADKMRVISIEFVFREQGESLFPSIITKTLSSVIGTVSDALLKFGSEIAIGLAVVVVASGLIARLAGTGVTQSFATASNTAATDPAALVGMATGLPPPDDSTSYGRYANGSAYTALPPGTTVASLQGQMAVQRVAVAAAAAAASAAAAAFSATTAQTLVNAIAGLIEALRAMMSNPADQIRVLLGLATFTDTKTYGATGLSANAGIVAATIAATCRRCALTSLALASAAYQPSSFQDAVAVRDQIAAALDVEITAAGDAGDDQSYIALKNVRAAVIQDLTTRAAALPLVMTITLPSNMPSLVVAYRLYRDASRSDEIAAETNVIHPAFLPTTMQVLAS